MGLIENQIVQRLLKEEEDDFLPTPLLSRGDHLKKREAFLKERIGREVDAITQGYRSLCQRAAILDFVPVQLPSWETLTTRLAEATGGGENQPLQHLAHLSDEAMAFLYSAARSLLDEEKWEEAQNGLLFLVTFNPYIARFWVAFGLFFETRSEFSEALTAYRMAAELAPDEPDGYLLGAALATRCKEWELAEAFISKGMPLAGREMKRCFKELESQKGMS